MHLLERTYAPIHFTVNEIIQNQVATSLAFNVKVPTDNQNLPFIYLIPKFHKKPVKFRPIIASSRAVTKKVSKIIDRCLGLCLESMEHYCRVIYNIERINAFWIINNNKKILNFIKDLSRKNSLRTVNTYDFTTLYTSLQQNELNEVFTKLIEIFFKINKKEHFINFYMGKPYFTNKKTEQTISGAKLLDMIKWLINNTYFTCGTNVYKQQVGLPMGTDSAPKLANAFLFYYEYNFMIKNKYAKYNICRSLNYVCRFQDDITVINDNGNFEKSYKEIYPASLELQKVNTLPTEANVLDINIKIRSDNTGETTLFDKRTDFPFPIVQFPSKSSNISKSTAMGVFISQVLRYSEIIYNTDFTIEIKKLIKKFITKGYGKKSLKHTLINTLRKYPEIKERHFSTNTNSKALVLELFKDL